MSPNQSELAVAIKLVADVPPPVYAHPGDAGADLPCAVDVVIHPGERVLVPTGVEIGRAHV